jgi:Flp pilus assembly protein TadD
MQPRLLQWEPIIAIDDVVLVPRAGCEADAAMRVTGAARLATARIEVQVHGVNIDGGTIDCGAAGDVVRILPAPLDDILAAVRALAPVVEPARFVVCGEVAIAIASPTNVGRAAPPEAARSTIASPTNVGRAAPPEAARSEITGDVDVTPVADWVDYLASQGAEAAAVDALIEGHDEPRAEHVAEAEAAVRISPDAHRPRAHLGWLLMRLGRHADAVRELERAIAMPAPDHVQAYAWANLGYALDELGRFDEAIAWYERAVEARRVQAHRINLGMVYGHAGRHADAWEMLRPYHAGRRLFDLARAMAALGRLGDARALLRAALETEPSLLDPVPENQWPKPPDPSWAAARDDLVALVTAAESRDRG